MLFLSWCFYDQCFWIVCTFHVYWWFSILVFCLIGLGLFFMLLCFLLPVFLFNVGGQILLWYFLSRLYLLPLFCYFVLSVKNIILCVPLLNHVKLQYFYIFSVVLTLVLGSSLIYYIFGFFLPLFKMISFCTYLCIKPFTNHKLDNKCCLWINCWRGGGYQQSIV